MSKQITIGSEVFFSKFDDYKIKDHDILLLNDSYILNNVPIVKMNDGINDVFILSPMSKLELINIHLSDKYMPMACGKFLIPEFVKEIKFTIDDLKLFKDKFNLMDDKHQYEKIIFNSYIENNDFYLTDELLNKAYKMYKNKR